MILATVLIYATARLIEGVGTLLNVFGLSSNTSSVALFVLSIWIAGSALAIACNFLGLTVPMLFSYGAPGLFFSLTSSLVQNVIYGIVIPATNYYKVGDYVEVVGVGGFIVEMNLFVIILRGSDKMYHVSPLQFASATRALPLDAQSTHSPTRPPPAPKDRSQTASQ